MSLAGGKDNPASFAVVRACACTDTPRAQLRGLEVRRIFIYWEWYARSQHALRCVTAGQHPLPKRPQTQQKDTEGIRLHRSDRALRCAPAGIRRVGRRAARVRVPFQACTVQKVARSFEKEKKESRGVGEH